MAARKGLPGKRCQGRGNDAGTIVPFRQDREAVGPVRPPGDARPCERPSPTERLPRELSWPAWPQAFHYGTYTAMQEFPDIPADDDDGQVVRHWLSPGSYKPPSASGVQEVHPQWQRPYLQPRWSLDRHAWPRTTALPPALQEVVGQVQ